MKAEILKIGEASVAGRSLTAKMTRPLRSIGRVALLSLKRAAYQSSRVYLVLECDALSEEIVVTSEQK